MKMYLLLASLLFAQDVDINKNEKIYVAPPTIHDDNLKGYQSYINSLIVSSANVNTHWLKRTRDVDTVHIYDKHTIRYALDTTCNYSRPLECASENYHWVLITDIFTTEKFATVVVKLYDENIQLIASSTKSSYSIEKCKIQIKETEINQTGILGLTKTEITEKLPDKCLVLKSSILDRDIKQAVAILFASIHPD